MKVVFVYPECENLGIEYLSACLKMAGHSVELIFDPMLFRTYYLRLGFLNRHFDYREIVLEKIRVSNADLICFSVFSDYYGWACNMARAIKQQNADIPIVFGGIHTSSVPEQVIKEPFIDYVCVGEGEEALVELANMLGKNEDCSQIKNIWSKKNGQIVKNDIRALITNLDTIPFPDKELFRNEFKYFLNVYTIISSRGCIHACSYCYNSFYGQLYKNKGKYLRRRSVNNVIEELVVAKNEYHVKRISFFDDLFISDLDWLREFSIKYKKNINLPYFCHVHPSYINKDSLTLLEGSECSSVTMGIQTIDAHIRNKICGRMETNEQIRQAINLIRRTRIFLYTNVIFGLPLQSEEVMCKDVAFANEMRVDIPASNWLRYYPKTRIVQIAKEHNLLTDNDIMTIEQGKEYLPYSIGGNTYNITGAKLRNMLIISHLLPKRIVKYILEKKIYRILPTVNMRFFIASFITIYRKIFLGKRFPFVQLSLKEVAIYYFYYMFKNTIN